VFECAASTVFVIQFNRSVLVGFEPRDFVAVVSELAFLELGVTVGKSAL
jgi:hypothetical protein